MPKSVEDRIEFYENQSDTERAVASYLLNDIEYAESIEEIVEVLAEITGLSVDEAKKMYNEYEKKRSELMRSGATLNRLLNEEVMIIELTRKYVGSLLKEKVLKFKKGDKVLVLDSYRVDHKDLVGKEGIVEEVDTEDYDASIYVKFELNEGVLKGFSGWFNPLDLKIVEDYDGNEIKARLIQKYHKENDRKEWALVSKSDNSKVLKWFGTTKPSKEAVNKEERRVQYYKHKG